MLIAAVVVCLSTPAVADYTTISPVRPLTLSDPSGLSSIGLEFQLTRWNEVLNLPPEVDVDHQTINLDITADIKLAPHWVLIGRLPLSKASIDGDPALDGCCGFGLGNLTVGGRGLWASIFDSGARAVAGAEFSISLPTASDSGEGGISAGEAAFARLPHDVGRYAPNTTTLRLTGLSQYYTKRFLVQGELGLQIFLYDDEVPGDSSDLGIRFAVGAGIRATYTLAVLLELNSLLFASDRGDDDTFTSVDIGLRYASGRAIFGGRLYLPVDSPLRDFDMFGIGLDAGFRF
jgi:hypothetical protein